MRVLWIGIVLVLFALPFIKVFVTRLYYPYAAQSLQTKDDNKGTYKKEESIWTNQFTGKVGKTGLSSGKIKKDERSGLYWSASSESDIITNLSNIHFAGVDGERPSGGNAIAFCNNLNSQKFAGKSDWYLPTQKELMQAYIDGIYSQDPEFGTVRRFWSSTECLEGAGYAWYVDLSYGHTYDVRRIINMSVRCVRRD